MLSLEGWRVVCEEKEDKGCGVETCHKVVRAAPSNEGCADESPSHEGPTEGDDSHKIE